MHEMRILVFERGSTSRRHPPIPRQWGSREKYRWENEMENGLDGWVGVVPGGGGGRVSPEKLVGEVGTDGAPNIT